MNKEKLKNLIDVSMGRKSADLCIKNCKVIDVFNKEIKEENVYIYDDLIAGFGKEGFIDAKNEFDAKGMYLSPSFIDSHVHIESSHLSPGEYAKLVIVHGTTCVVADPHEICNVCRLDGLDYMLNASSDLPLTVYFQFPSCVPATDFENSGCVLLAEDVKKRLYLERILGLGEMMNYVGVVNNDDVVLDKIIACMDAKKIIDGHSPNVHSTMLDAYSACKIRTDHECSSPEELKERIKRGIYVLLREGTVCLDLVNLIKGVSDKNKQYCLMCTDDCQAETLINRGHIDNNVRLAIKNGLDPIDAICMASINASECFRLDERGAIAPGRKADFILFKDLNDIRIMDVFSNGKHVASNGKMLVDIKSIVPQNVQGRVKVKKFSVKDLALKLKKNDVKTIKINPGSVVTSIGNAKINLDKDNNWIRNNDDIVKIAVIERHHEKGNIGLALLEGFGLKGGAIATSVAHDSHNIIVAGDNDDDMYLTVQKLIKMGGGMTIFINGKEIESVEHEIAGLMTNKSGEEVAKLLASIQNTARTKLKIHDNVDPFMTLCFMSLPVIPQIKLTDLGLFDVCKFQFTSVEN